MVKSANEQNHYRLIGVRHDGTREVLMTGMTLAVAESAAKSIKADCDFAEMRIEHEVRQHRRPE